MGFSRWLLYARCVSASSAGLTATIHVLVIIKASCRNITLHENVMTSRSVAATGLITGCGELTNDNNYTVNLKYGLASLDTRIGL